MPLNLMYITNNPIVASVAESNNVDRIWVDLETIGKEKRQQGMNTVKSHHTMQDVSNIRVVLKKADLLVRINPLYEGTKAEIDEAVSRGADIIMLPMFRTVDDASRFVEFVAGRAKVLLLAETIDAERNMSQIVRIPGIDEIYIGLNDLHLEYRKKFLFELLADGTVDRICDLIRPTGIPFGFGGLAKLDSGLLPGRYVLAEHYRLGSESVILSRAFFDSVDGYDADELDKAFRIELKAIRDFEKKLENESPSFFEENRHRLVRTVEEIVENKLIHE